MNIHNARVALITGGAGAIGRSIGARLANQGIRVVFADLIEEEARNVARELSDDALGISIDVTSASSVAQAVEMTVAITGRVDILVNSAGISVPGDSSEMDETAFERVMSVNLKGPFLVVRALIPILKKQKYGRIVSLGTRNSLAGGMPAYGSSKYALEALSVSWARELGPWNVTANVVSPGPVAVSNGMGLIKRTYEEQLHMSRHYINRTPISRLATCEDVATAVAYFASEEAGFVTGETLCVAGGAQLAPAARYSSDPV